MEPFIQFSNIKFHQQNGNFAWNSKLIAFGMNSFCIWFIYAFFYFSADEEEKKKKKKEKLFISWSDVTNSSTERRKIETEKKEHENFRQRLHAQTVYRWSFVWPISIYQRSYAFNIGPDCIYYLRWQKHCWQGWIKPRRKEPTDNRTFFASNTILNCDSCLFHHLL